jgi:riboflavin synthase
MFTGIIEEIGKVKNIKIIGDGRRIEFAASNVLDDLGIDNSIAINGTCLTVVQRTKSSFTVDIVKETLLKTNLGALKVGYLVNLERSVSAQQRLGGHFVLGHVDTTGTILKRTDLESSWMFTISYPAKFKKFLIPVGSISVDGVSLTVARLHSSSFEVAIIPYTMDHTIFSRYGPKRKVNLEFDLIGKYIESILKQSFIALKKKK